MHKTYQKVFIYNSWILQNLFMKEEKKKKKKKNTSS